LSLSTEHRRDWRGGGTRVAGSLAMSGKSDRFEEAYRRARRKIGPDCWRHLTNEEQEAAVAEELRILSEENGEPSGGDKLSDGA
jgi:hypothetical protein